MADEGHKKPAHRKRAHKKPAPKMQARGTLRFHRPLNSLDKAFYRNPRDAETDADATHEEVSESSAGEGDDEESESSAEETDEEKYESSAEAMEKHAMVPPLPTPPGSQNFEASPVPEALLAFDEASPVPGALPIPETSPTTHWDDSMPHVSQDLQSWMAKSGRKYVHEQIHARTTEEVDTTSEDAVALVTVLNLINQDPDRAEELIDAMRER
jgi:hypothetical protein